jgi:hypothetical protein
VQYRDEFWYGLVHKRKKKRWPHYSYQGHAPSIYIKRPDGPYQQELVEEINPYILTNAPPRKETFVNYKVEREKINIMTRHLARLESKSVITSVDEIGIAFLKEEIARRAEYLPKDWDQFAQEEKENEQDT